MPRASRRATAPTSGGTQGPSATGTSVHWRSWASAAVAGRAPPQPLSPSQLKATSDLRPASSTCRQPAPSQLSRGQFFSYFILYFRRPEGTNAGNSLFSVACGWPPKISAYFWPFRRSRSLIQSKIAYFRQHLVYFRQFMAAENGFRYFSER